MITIPESYITGLNLIPKDTPVAILMRHAERFEIKKGDSGLQVPLTDDGRQSAYKLGEEQFKGKDVAVYSSYIGRCIDTGEHVLKGAELKPEVIQEGILSGDKIFVSDFAKMVSYYLEHGMLSLLELMYDREEVEGMNPITASAHQFLDFMLTTMKKHAGFSLFVTHDMFISLFVGEIFRYQTTADNWPEFMEPVFLWEEDQCLKLFFRNILKTIPIP